MTATNATGRDQTRPGSILLPSLGILLVTGGFILLGWFAYLWFTPAPAPYQYQLLTTGDPDQYPELGLQDWPELTLSQHQIQITGIDKPVAQATLARRDNSPPVLIDWQSHTSELLLAVDRKPTELPQLAKVISQHASSDALILGWWDTSRQINLLTGIDTLFTDRLNEPLIIPGQWQDQSQAIRNYENEFWQTNATEQQHDQFKRFSQALTAPLEQGIDQLRQLIGSEREAYLIIHVSDLYKLGLMYPDKIGVAYQNFPLTGNMHGLINHMKVLLKQKDYDTYTLQSLSDQEIRVYFLTDEQSENTLMAQLLPFAEKTAPLELTEPQLIYQHDGYWVYQIP